MKPTPQGWPRVSSAVFYDDAGAAIDWLCRAFGFKVRIRVDGENGRVEHSELEFGEDGLIMVGRSGGRSFPCKSPQSLAGVNTQALCLFVDDVDEHCEQARSAGAIIAEEPSTIDYGPDYWVDRNYRAVDPEGHQWWFTQRLRG